MRHSTITITALSWNPAHKYVKLNASTEAFTDRSGGPWRARTAGPNVRCSVWFNIGDLRWAATASSNGWHMCSLDPANGGGYHPTDMSTH